MLNKELFNLLWTVTGEKPEVTYENDPGKLVAAPGKSKAYKVAGGEKYHIRCPVCEDTMQKRLAFSYLCGQTAMVPSYKTAKKFSGHMYRCLHNECQRGPALRKWVKKTGMLDLGMVNITEQDVEMRKISTFNVHNLTEIPLPKGAVALTSSTVPEHVQDYMYERRFSPDELFNEYGVLYAPPGTTWEHIPEDGIDDEGYFKEFREDNLIVPVVRARRVIGWQARVAGETDRVRHYTAPGTKTGSVLYNMDMAKFFPGVCFSEGPPDVWRVSMLREEGICGVGLLGKDLSEEKIKIAKTLWGYENNWGCVLLDSQDKDPDAPRAARKMARKLKQAGVCPAGLLIAELNTGDPDDHTPEDLLKVIQGGELCR